ncbi:hypothetical protein BJX99DRAFT_267950 [Aspergillus californicus]
MASTLPTELLICISDILRRENVSFIPCIPVNRHWRAALEPLLYPILTVYSSEEYKDEGQEGIPLAHFKSLTSGPNTHRRSWIREIRYEILVPFELGDWETETDDSVKYIINNPIRRLNDEAFQDAVVELFRELSDWDSAHRISLRLELRSQRPDENDEAPERDTWYSSYAHKEYPEEETYRAIEPYRARFLVEDGASSPSLESGPCIQELAFKNVFDRDKRDHLHQIWAGCALDIARYCPTLEELDLDLDEWVRPDFLKYIRCRRDTVAKGLEDLPPTLRVLRYKNSLEEPWNNTMSALNVLSTDVDVLALNLRMLSFSLRELVISKTSLPLDFLCPLDETGEPIPDLETREWPNLRKLELINTPAALPSGKWLMRPNPGFQKRRKRISPTNEGEISEYEEIDGEPFCPSPDTEGFDRLCISLGYAFRRMPQVTAIGFNVTGSCFYHIVYRFDERSGDWILEWESHARYRPDERVARAWGFEWGDLRANWFYPEACSAVIRGGF